MPEHLLPMSVLHAAAPGILDVVFGKDGAHEDAPMWRAPLRGRPVLDGVHIVSSGRVLSYVLDGAKAWTSVGPSEWAMIQNAALDLLLPSTACRLAGLCIRATGDLPQRADLDLCWEIIAEAMDNRIHPDTAARMVVLTLRLAPKIAALGSLS